MGILIICSLQYYDLMKSITILLIFICLHLYQEVHSLQKNQNNRQIAYGSLKAGLFRSDITVELNKQMAIYTLIFPAQFQETPQILINLGGFGTNPSNSLDINIRAKSTSKISTEIQLKIIWQSIWSSIRINYLAMIDSKVQVGNYEYYITMSPNSSTLNPYIVLKLNTNSDQNSNYSLLSVFICGIHVSSALNTNQIGVSLKPTTVPGGTYHIWLYKNIGTNISFINVGYFATKKQHYNDSFLVGTINTKSYQISQRAKLSFSTDLSIVGFSQFKCSNRDSVQFNIYQSFDNLDLLINIGKIETAINYILLRNTYYTFVKCDKNKHKYYSSCVDICPFGMLSLNNTCVPLLSNNSICPLFSKFDIENCKCIQGFIIDTKVCTPNHKNQQRISNCIHNSQWNGIQCVCTINFVMQGQSCVPVTSLGNPCVNYFNSQYKQGSCICPQGYVRMAQQCIWKQPQKLMQQSQSLNSKRIKYSVFPVNHFF